LSYIVEAIPPTLITIGILGILFIVKGAYLTYKESANSKETVKDKSRPQLEIVFKSEPPFIEHTGHNYTSDGRLAWSTIRIGVTHTSSKTVRHVQARVERLDFERDAPVYDAPLRIMHDNYPYVSEFSVDPGETQFVEVAAKGRIMGEVIEICHVIAHERMSMIEIKTHDLKIKVTGEDALPTSTTLRLSVTEKGLLTAKIIES
jgi:hypothetical protein